ncbi:unnamed protein product [Adineta ricciae]|uniref:DYW domain-containing protein n=1 Tax=Adineta ricciae TaxID=249248 RepID=A0A816GH94_ADIRI|nr:unnamed protein product [Adineta ricciae]
MSTDLKIQSALVHMWGKAGCVNQAKQVFQQINRPNSVTYTAMINAYGLNGMGHDALELYYQMPSEMIVEKTYVCILNACSHSGLVEEARSIFSKIPKKDEWIYTAMIDCLCRSFIFDEAKQLIENYENNHRPCLPMYKALLSGARNRTDVLLARQTIHRIQQLFRGMDKSLVSASAGELEEALQIRSKLSGTRVKKKMGLSWTEANGEIVEFHAQDRSHAQTQEIYDELQRIEHELIEHGHNHSERLALAFNFIQRPIPSQIQIVENLRICGDCHRAIKLISQILIRDANRIHHFSHGIVLYFSN